MVLIGAHLREGPLLIEKGSSAGGGEKTSRSLGKGVSGGNDHRGKARNQKSLVNPGHLKHKGGCLSSQRTAWYRLMRGDAD